MGSEVILVQEPWRWVWDPLRHFAAGRPPSLLSPLAGSSPGARAAGDRHVRSLLGCPWQWEGFFSSLISFPPRRQPSPRLVNSACEQVAEAHLGSASMSARSLRPRRLHACPKLRPPCPAAPRQGLSPEDPRRSPLRSQLCAALHG